MKTCILIKIDPAGRLSIPISVRKRTNIKPGETVALSIINDNELSLVRESGKAEPAAFTAFKAEASIENAIKVFEYVNKTLTEEKI